MLSSTEDEFKGWEDRWNNLNEQIKSMSTIFEASRIQGVPRMQTLKHSLDSLGIFAQTHLKYFKDNVEGTLKENGMFSKQYVFSSILEQISFDIQVLQQAANQRINGSKEMKETLECADKLAYAALLPVLGTRGKGLTTTVTYIRQSTLVRVIPYADVVLIGIPFTCIPAPLSSLSKFSAQDYLAIPHEIGHYLFWRGIIKNGEIETPVYAKYRKDYNNAPEEQKIYYRWAEEIFADVYGCLIAGAFIALDFQDLQLRKSQEDFIDDDGDHPPPIIRPDIYTRVLHLKEKDELANNLNRKWEAKRDKMDLIINTGDKRKKANLKKSLAEQSEIIQNEIVQYKIIVEKTPIKDIVTPIGEAMTPVDTIVDEMFGLLNMGIDLKDNWWIKNELLLTDVDQPFEKFAERLAVIDIEVPKESKTITSEKVNELHTKWENNEGIKSPTNMPEWLPVLEAGGWLTKGPECEGPGTCG